MAGSLEREAEVFNQVDRLLIGRRFTPIQGSSLMESVWIATRMDPRLAEQVALAELREQTFRDQVAAAKVRIRERMERKSLWPRFKAWVHAVTAP
jgi:hypothetical protein